MEQNRTIISRNRIARGIKLFLALTFAGAFIILYRSSFTESIALLRGFRIGYLVLIVILALSDWIISGLRVYIFAKKIHPGISFQQCVRANLACIFLGGVTPSQTGGGAGQIYALYRYGMRLVDATVTSFLPYISTVVFLPVCGILITIFVGPQFEGTYLHAFSRATILVFSLILAAVILSLVDPVRFESFARSVLGAIPLLGKKIKGSARIDEMFHALQRYHELMILFLRRRMHYIVAGFILTALIYFNKFVIAYLVIRGLGIEAEFWQVIYLQLILILVFYFSPTPGSSGLAEVGSAVIMGQIVPKTHVGIFVLLWRFFTLFIGMAAGSYVLLGTLLTPGKENAREMKYGNGSEDLEVPGG